MIIHNLIREVSILSSYRDLATLKKADDLIGDPFLQAFFASSSATPPPHLNKKHLNKKNESHIGHEM